DADTGGTSGAANLDHIDYPPRASDDRWHALLEYATASAGPHRFLALGLVEKLDRERLCRVWPFHRCRIGAIGEDEPTGGVAKPDRSRNRFEEGARLLGLALRMAQPLGQGGVLKFDPGHVAEPQRCRASHRATLRFDMATARRHQIEGEGLTALAERVDGVIECLCLFDSKPGAEGKHAPIRRNAGHFGHLPENQRILLGAAPHHDDLWLRKEQRHRSIRL